jgi:hypothetical protein
LPFSFFQLNRSQVRANSLADDDNSNDKNLDGTIKLLNRRGTFYKWSELFRPACIEQKFYAAQSRKPGLRACLSAAHRTATIAYTAALRLGSYKKNHFTVEYESNPGPK